METTNTNGRGLALITLFGLHYLLEFQFNPIIHTHTHMMFLLCYSAYTFHTFNKIKM